MEFQDLTNEAKLYFMLLHQCENKQHAAYWWRRITGLWPEQGERKAAIEECDRFLKHCAELRRDRRAKQHAANMKGKL